MNRVLEFIGFWNQHQCIKGEDPPARGKSRGIQIMALCQGDDIYGVEIRFSAKAYVVPDDVFGDELRDRALRYTGGALRLRSSYDECRNGILSYAVAFCNYGYNQTKLLDWLEDLVTNVLPSFER